MTRKVYTNIEEFQTQNTQLRTALPLSTDTAVLNTPLQVGNQTVPNRLAYQAMEGCDGTADGSPDYLTNRRYERFAKGGAGLIWFEATAVMEEGRANPRQLWIRDDNLDAYRRIVENIKETMQNGNFFMVTRNLRQNVVNDIGPDEAFDVIDKIGMAYPMFTKVSVDGHKITVAARDADKLQFIANGKVIAKYDIGESEITLDLDTIEGAEDFLYVRAELLGEGGMTITQALTIDNGAEKLEFVEKTGIEALWEDILTVLSSLRIVVIVQEIIRAI